MKEKTIFTPKELENRNGTLYEQLVPANGKCETAEGEMLRAVNKVIYRYYNDGDVWWRGYGAEVVGPCVAYLTQANVIDAKSNTIELSSLIEASDGVDGNKYITVWHKILDKVLTYIETNGAKTPNYLDMLAFEPKYEDEDDDWCYEEDDSEDDDF